MNVRTHWQHEWLRPGYGYALGTGLCLGAGFFSPILWPLGIVGIMLMLRLAQSHLSTQRLVLMGIGAWFIKDMLVLSWFVSTYPVGWIGPLPAWIQIGVIGGYWMISAFGLAVGGGLFTYVAHRLYRSALLPRFLWYVLGPFIWVVSEWFSAYFFSVLSVGPGSFIQNYFSFGMMGYLLAETWLGIQWAGVVGLYGLGISMVSLATIGLLVVRTRQFRMVLFGVVATVVVGVYSHVMAVPSKAEDSPVGVTVIGIDTTFPSDIIDTTEGIQAQADAFNQAITAALTTEPDYVLLPEESRILVTTYAGLSAGQAMERFQFTHRNTESTLIDTGRVDMPNGDAYLRATIFDGKNKQVYQFDKQYLVPQGEFVPYVSELILRLLGLLDIVDQIKRTDSYRPGPLTRESVKDLPSDLPGILFCFESVRPDGVAALTSPTRPPFVVHPLSHSWFHQPFNLWHQLDVMLIVQARTTGIPIVSAGNMVSGKLYLPNGQIEAGEVIQSGENWVLRQFTF